MPSPKPTKKPARRSPKSLGKDAGVVPVPPSHAVSPKKAPKPKITTPPPPKAASGKAAGTKKPVRSPRPKTALPASPKSGSAAKKKPSKASTAAPPPSPPAQKKKSPKPKLPLASVAPKRAPKAPVSVPPKVLPVEKPTFPRANKATAAAKRRVQTKEQDVAVVENETLLDTPPTLPRKPIERLEEVHASTTTRPLLHQIDGLTLFDLQGSAYPDDDVLDRIQALVVDEKTGEEAHYETVDKKTGEVHSAVGLPWSTVVQLLKKKKGMRVPHLKRGDVVRFSEYRGVSAFVVDDDRTGQQILWKTSGEAGTEIPLYHLFRAGAVSNLEDYETGPLDGFSGSKKLMY